MKLPQLLHSSRSYGRANSAFWWKLLVLERGFPSYRLKLPCDRSEKDAWFGYSRAYQRPLSARLARCDASRDRLLSEPTAGVHPIGGPRSSCPETNLGEHAVDRRDRVDFGH